VFYSTCPAFPPKDFVGELFDFAAEGAYFFPVAGLFWLTGGTPPFCGSIPVFAPKSSINSCSFSSRLLFQTITTESAPPVVKKSPQGEKATD